MKEYGFELNASGVISEDANMTLGVHFTDSDGSDINIEKEGKDISDMFQQLAFELIKQYSYQKKKRELEAEEASKVSIKSTVDVNDEETNSLKTNLDLANQRIEYLQNQLEELRKQNNDGNFGKKTKKAIVDNIEDRDRKRDAYKYVGYSPYYDIDDFKRYYRYFDDSVYPWFTRVMC